MGLNIGAFLLVNAKTNKHSSSYGQMSIDQGCVRSMALGASLVTK